MKYVWILAMVAGSVANAGQLECFTEGAQVETWLIHNENVPKEYPLDATNAVLVLRDDDGSITNTLGSTKISKARGKTDFSFEDQTRPDWAAIDPNKKCYIARVTAHIDSLDDLEVEGEVKFHGRFSRGLVFEKHPRKPDCEVPAYKPAKPVKIVCDIVSLHHH